MILAGTESGQLHVAIISDGQIQVDTAEKLNQSNGHAVSSLVYSIRWAIINHFYRFFVDTIQNESCLHFAPNRE